jgi:hypothetical protein
LWGDFLYLQKRPLMAWLARICEAGGEMQRRCEGASVREEKETTAARRRIKRRELTRIVGGGRDRQPRWLEIPRKRWSWGRVVETGVGEEPESSRRSMGCRRAASPVAVWPASGCRTREGATREETRLERRRRRWRRAAGWGAMVWR